MKPVLATMVCMVLLENTVLAAAASEAYVDPNITVLYRGKSTEYSVGKMPAFYAGQFVCAPQLKLENDSEWGAYMSFDVICLRDTKYRKDDEPVFSASRNCWLDKSSTYLQWRNIESMILDMRAGVDRSTEVVVTLDCLRLGPKVKPRPTKAQVPL